MRIFRLLAIGVVLLVLVGAILGTACAGARGEQGPQGPKGDTGANGVGVENIVNNGDGTITVSLTNGESYTSDDLTGPQGEQGIQGREGFQGIQGEKGDTGLPGVGISWEGEWSSSGFYNLYDAVGYLGSSYVSKQDGNINHVPTDPNWWDLWVEKGNTGEQGLQGVQGEKGDTGDQGTQGVQGIQGIQGEPGPNMIVAMGYINGDGTVQQGYNIISCSGSAGVYFIELAGISYSYYDYITMVVAGGNHASFGGVDGTLIVVIFDHTGSAVAGGFTFMVLDATP